MRTVQDVSGVIAETIQLTEFGRVWLERALRDLSLSTHIIILTFILRPVWPWGNGFVLYYVLKIGRLQLAKFTTLKLPLVCFREAVPFPFNAHTRIYPVSPLFLFCGLGKFLFFKM